MTRRIKDLGVAFLAFGMCAVSGLLFAQSEVVVDLAGENEATFDASGERNKGWTISGEVSSDPLHPRVWVRGIFESNQGIESAANLSYRILGSDGNAVISEGHRFSWRTDVAGARVAEFEIELPQVLTDPSVREFRVAFDAVVEHQYWYRDQFPEISFPELVVRNMPRRDHYAPNWAWVPRFLPANIPVRIPVSFSVRYRDHQSSGFVPALDVVSAADEARVPSRRIAVDGDWKGDFRGWMVMDPQPVGKVLVRPGLVWENVRWYEANGWFERQSVTVISLRWYTLGLICCLLAGFGLWGRVGRWRKKPFLVLGRTVLVSVFIWLIGQTMISGFSWLLILFGVVSVSSRYGGGKFPGFSTYLCTWCYMVFLEVYWTQLAGSVEMRSSGLWFSVGVWTILLLPLVAIKVSWVRCALALFGTLLWTGATMVAVVYFQFFQDYPSIQNLSYAGQAGELGDSIMTLIEDRHVIPLLVWAFVPAFIWMARSQRKTQIEKT